MLDQRRMKGSRAPQSQNSGTGVFPLNQEVCTLGPVGYRGLLPVKRVDSQGLNRRCNQQAAWGWWGEAAWHPLPFCSQALGQG